MENKICLQNWIGNFICGEYDSADVKTQIKAGWYDWFCKDDRLAPKTKRVGKILCELRVGGKVDFKGWYVWFKNNCPINGNLYDDFRFADLENGEVQMTIQIECCWNLRRFVVYGRKMPGAPFEDKPLFQTDSKKELINWLNTAWEN